MAVTVIRSRMLSDTFLFITEGEVFQFGLHIDEVNEVVGANRASMKCVTSLKPGERKMIRVRIEDDDSTSGAAGNH